MRINRLELVKQVEARIAAREAAAAEANAKEAAREAERRAAYQVASRGAWAQLADVIRLRIGANEPVLASDIPEGVSLRHTGPGYRPEPHRERKVADVAVLRRLVALLEVSPDETVSLAALERSGFLLGKILA